jgi:hypothetical protein
VSGEDCGDGAWYGAGPGGTRGAGTVAHALQAAQIAINDMTFGALRMTHHPLPEPVFAA